MRAMKTYRIYSNYMFNFYRIDEAGNVIETENGTMTGTNWKITGAWYSKAFGHIGFIPLPELLKIKDFRLKDGRPRYGLTDIDHGTSRLHGNRDVHGIRCIIAE